MPVEMRSEASALEQGWKLREVRRELDGQAGRGLDPRPPPPDLVGREDRQAHPCPPGRGGAPRLSQGQDPLRGVELPSSVMNDPKKMMRLPLAGIIFDS